MTTAPLKKNCPSVEELSQFMDLTVADLSQPQWDVVASHVKECAACRNKLAAYQRLDQAIEAALAPPPGLAERIKAVCRDGNAREMIRPFPWWRKGWGKAAIAAAVLAFAGLTAININNLDGDKAMLSAAPQGASRQSAAPAVAESSRLLEVASAVPMVASAPQTSNSDADADGSLYERGKRASSVNSQDLRMASMGGKAQTASANSVKYLLPDRVRHVWTVDDLACSRQRLADASVAMNAPVAWSNDGERGRLMAVLRLTDGELQQLVDRLGDGHWALVSPYLPQPNAPDLVHLTGKRLLYEIILVQREK
ncbi:MAG: anti-sigma factor family protein [Lentisphaeria bacterium]|jgi:hypothetical protein